MGLRNIVIPTATIAVGDSEFSVRGISAFDIGRAFEDFGAQLSIAFAMAIRREEGQTFSSDLVRSRIKELVSECPDVVAAIVAMAADDYSREAMAVFKKLPLMEQIATLEAIYGLTFKNDGDLGKLVELVTQGMASAATALTNLSTR